MQMKELAVGILAGGKSSRMGSNKAKLRYGDTSFLEHLLAQARGFGERLLSVDEIRKYQWLAENASGSLKDDCSPVILVEDELAGFGPVEGIYQILQHSRMNACLVVATDMPGLTEDFFRTFADAYAGEDCLVLRAGGSPEPLCSVYGKTCVPVLASFRKEGIRRPRLLFERVNTGYLDIETLGCGENVVRNINTPDEYRKFLDGSK